MNLQNRYVLFRRLSELGKTENQWTLLTQVVKQFGLNNDHAFFSSYDIKILDQVSE